MPRIGAVDGLSFSVYFRDHPPPHFHARAAGREALIGFEPIRILRSNLRASEERAALAWAEANLDVIRAAWADNQII